MIRYLTKSRFKTAIECPTKLAYTGNKAYANTKDQDEFLKTLADGGFQIGELAKLLYPGSEEVIVDGHDEQVRQTEELLKKTDVVIFEAAIRWGNLFARVDILKKVGSHIELIEVKAKTYDPVLGERNFENQDGTISASSNGMLPYLQDVAFQTFVLQKMSIEKNYGFTVDSFLMLCDKSAPCTVDGLNQKFKLVRSKDKKKTSVEIQPGTNINTIGKSILTKVDVNKYVERILANPLVAPGMEGFFEPVVVNLAQKYVDDIRIEPKLGGQCAKCEFRSDDSSSELKSGFHECWNKFDMSRPTVLDLYRLRASDKTELILNNKIYLDDLEDDDLKVKSEASELTQSQRRKLQVDGVWSKEKPFFLDREHVSREMSSWTYPYSFIDFETCAVAVPFFKGKRTYAPVAFQFSIHTIDEAGVVKHAGQFLEAEPGQDPTYNFVRALKQQLNPLGSVFMWSSYENTTLNRIYKSMSEDLANQTAPEDVSELMSFINDLVVRKDEVSKKIIHRGRRAMVDLCAIAEKSFFHPNTKGRSSIKLVLPAVLKDSAWLRDRYSKPIYGSLDGIYSKNFKDKTWWQVDLFGKIISPYELLDPLFDDVVVTSKSSDLIVDDLDVKEGGAASTAFARLQFENINNVARSKIKQSLLRYCELDTLAMLMVYEAWETWICDS